MFCIIEFKPIEFRYLFSLFEDAFENYKLVKKSKKELDKEGDNWVKNQGEFIKNLNRRREWEV